MPEHVIDDSTIKSSYTQNVCLSEVLYTNNFILSKPRMALNHLSSFTDYATVSILLAFEQLL